MFTALPGEGLEVTSTSTNQQSSIDPTANISEAPDTSTTASAHETTDYTSQPTPLNPSVTMATSTNVTPSTTVSTGSLATVEGVVTMLIPSPVSQAPPFSDANTANQITGYTQSPPITAQPAFQIPPPIPVPLGQWSDLYILYIYIYIYNKELCVYTPFLDYIKNVSSSINNLCSVH